MKSYRVLSAFAAVLALASCSENAVIDLDIKDASSCELIVKQLNVNSFDVLDTVRTDASGHLRYKVDVKRGQPEFIYVFKGDVSIAALLLEQGEKAVVEADTLGNYDVSGSQGSLKLKEVDASYSKFIYRMAELADAYGDISLPQSARDGLREEMSKLFVAHYRECTKFIIENPYSLAVVPVLFQQVSEYTPLFSQPSDGIRMRAAYDSLMTVYPDSRYVKALGKEADRLMTRHKLDLQLENATEASFFDIRMPDVNGQERALSEVDSRVVLIHFWTSSDADQKMFNIETLKPLYDEFHGKGLEIYSVCIDPDKAQWASAVKHQQLEWINVNDGLGTASTVLGVYNITELPTSYVLVDGELSESRINGEESLRKLLRKELK